MTWKKTANFLGRPMEECRANGRRWRIHRSHNQWGPVPGWTLEEYRFVSNGPDRPPIKGQWTIVLGARPRSECEEHIERGNQ